MHLSPWQIDLIMPEHSPIMYMWLRYASFHTQW